MTKFTADSLWMDIHDLENNVLRRVENRLQSELETFVKEFETLSITMETDKLDGCEDKLTKNRNLDQLIQDVTDTNAIMSSIPVHPRILFEEEKEAYRLTLDKRRKELENEIQRQSDRIESNYAKMTRDSIHRHLVGSHFGEY
ncbi:hypothetical protein BDB01DRAFT_852776 [Pilobolus umbonatus]|nr:hypothetical protein BDB01DRAFT_852776 [Pilobolus umbonatus]